MQPSYERPGLSNPRRHWGAILSGIVGVLLSEHFGGNGYEDAAAFLASFLLLKGGKTIFTAIFDPAATVDDYESRNP